MMNAMLGVVLLLGSGPRAAPIGMERGLGGQQFRLSGPRGLYSSIQLGRIQVVPWSLSSTKAPEDLARGLAGWQRRSDYNFEYERKVGAIRQTLFIYKQQIEDPSVRKNPPLMKEVSLVQLSEWPPEDGTVPEDWPTAFKRGIYRVIPDQVNILRGLNPSRVGTSLNPVGEGGEATYTLRTTLAAADAAVKKQFPKWRRVDARREILYTVLGNNPQFQRERRLNGITLRERDGSVSVVIRWTPGLGDRVGFSGKDRGKLIDATPRTKLPKALQHPAARAAVLQSGQPGPRVLSWEYTLTLSIEALKRKLKAEGVTYKEPKGLRGLVYVELDGKATRLVVSIRPGRVVERKQVPPGWKATADVAGFIDYVTVDLDRAVQVGLVESPK